MWAWSAVSYKGGRSLLVRVAGEEDEEVLFTVSKCANNNRGDL